MEQMSMEGMQVISMDYEDSGLPKPVRDFRPAVYFDGVRYGCLLGPDPQKGIYGSGANQNEAISNWLQQFTKRIEQPAANDEVAKEIIDSLSISKKDVW